MSTLANRIESLKEKMKLDRDEYELKGVNFRSLRKKELRPVETDESTETKERY